MILEMGVIEGSPHLSQKEKEKLALEMSHNPILVIIFTCVTDPQSQGKVAIKFLLHVIF